MNPTNLQNGVLDDSEYQHQFLESIAPNDEQDSITIDSSSIGSPMGKFDFPKKLGFLFKPKRFKGAKGGRGSGKSWAFARALLVLGIQVSLNILCVREIQDSITESVYALLVQQIEKMGFDNVGLYGEGAYQYNKVEIWNDLGTRITFSGLRYNLTKIKSREGIDICWVEEAEKISKESWDVLIPTIRKSPVYKDGVMISPGCTIYGSEPVDSSEIWFCYNPNSKFDNTHVRFASRHDDECEIVTMNWRDNPWFPEVLRKEMNECKRLNFKDYLHIWEGLTKEETGETTFKIEWLRTWGNPNVAGNIYILVDPANSKVKGSDYTVICVFIATQQGNLVLREFIRDRMEMEKFDKLFELVGRYRNMKYNVKVGYEKYGMQMDIGYIKERQTREMFFFDVVELGSKSTGKLSKIDRIKRLIPLFSETKIIMPPKMEYRQLDGMTVDLMEAFNQEFITYPFIPDSMHDDILDCMARITDEALNVVYPTVDTNQRKNEAKRRRERYNSDPATAFLRQDD